MDKLKEKHDLIKEAAIDGFSLLYLDKFRELQSKYPEDKQLYRECAQNIASIYTDNKLPNKALAIYLELIGDKNELSSFTFFNILFDTLSILTNLGRKDEAMQLFKMHFDTSGFNSFSEILPLLAWYVATFSPTENELASYETNFKNSLAALGYLAKSSSLSAQILESHTANGLAGRQYGAISMSKERLTSQEFIQALEQFVANDPPGFYKNMALEWLANLKHKLDEQ